jgi:hypothetical protein
VDAIDKKYFRALKNVDLELGQQIKMITKQKRLS